MPTGAVLVPGSNKGWFKIYTNTLAWSWNAKTWDNNAHDIFLKIANPSTYTIEISARSSGHAIDRLAIYLLSASSAATNSTTPETKCDEIISTINQGLNQTGNRQVKTAGFSNGQIHLQANGNIWKLNGAGAR